MIQSHLKMRPSQPTHSLTRCRQRRQRRQRRQSRQRRISPDNLFKWSFVRSMTIENLLSPNFDFCSLRLLKFVCQKDR